MAARPVSIVRVLEFGRVQLPGRLNTAATRERLERAALQTGFKAFELRGRQLHARGVVGVIDLGDLIVEILPKTHEECTHAEGALFLSELLKFSGVLQNLAVMEARVADGERTLLEIMLSWAVREAATNIREGLPRRYRVREESSTAIRGRVELRSLAHRRPGKDFELVIRHAPLTENNPLSSVVKWLLAEIERRTRLVPTRLMCRHLLHELQAVVCKTPDLQDLDRIVLQPAEVRWKPLLAFASLLMRQVSPDPGRAGAHSAVAVLFTLHDLFERVLSRVFREGLGRSSLTLHRTSRRLLEALPPSSGQSMSLRPDFVFASAARPAGALIGDAKWKRIFGPTGDVKLGEADAYQVTTYLAAFDAPAGFIFCPLSAPPLDGHLATADFTVSGLGVTLHITGVHLPTLIAESAAGVTARDALCAHIMARADTQPAKAA